jgi:hypothetical protein
VGFHASSPKPRNEFLLKLEWTVHYKEEELTGEMEKKTIS